MEGTNKQPDPCLPVRTPETCLASRRLSNIAVTKIQKEIKSTVHTKYQIKITFSHVCLLIY
jgi:hypothetical protein